MTNNVVAFHTPDAVRKARGFLITIMKRRFVSADVQTIFLDEFDRMVRGKPTPLFDTHPELGTFCSMALTHFETKRPE